MASGSAHRRLQQLSDGLKPPPASVGTLKLGAITYEVPESLNPSRLPHSLDLLDIQNPFNADNLYFLLQKYILGQDVFLISNPGPYSRCLALTFAKLINSEYEYIALHRDVGETELKQGREIRTGGNLVFLDSPAVNAAKHGRILILEGIEKAERGIMPVLNNLLENREMNLDDGTQIIHPHRYMNLQDEDISGIGKTLIPAHPNFRVIAIGAPVPPFAGFPLDPPFRSRFQARFIDPMQASLALGDSSSLDDNSYIWVKLREVILSTQLATESRHSLDSITSTALPAFPQTSLHKLRLLLSKYPPSPHPITGDLGRLILAVHPCLAHASLQAWAMLSRQMEDSGIGELGSPSMVSSAERIGFCGYRVASLRRVSQAVAAVTFEGPSGMPSVTHNVPAGPRPLLPWPIPDTPGLHLSERFIGLVTCMIQAHSLGWDISLIPPPFPSTASSSTSTLVKVFSEILGYESDVLHLYKELGGRELVMRRVVQEGGATTWEPSHLVSSALLGKMINLNGLDVMGATAGSLARLFRSRELELWDGKRIVADHNTKQMSDLSTSHDSFRVIATASKSQDLKEWLTEEHANMFFTIPLQHMDYKEEENVLLMTGCADRTIKVLMNFADKYRRSVSSDNGQNVRRLGTRSLIRICRRLALFPTEGIKNILCRSLLTEFLPMVERMNLNELFEKCEIRDCASMFFPSPVVQDEALIFPQPSSNGIIEASSVSIPLFDITQDPGGASLVPYLDHFYDNSLQTGLMRDLATDLELLGEHVVLIGNQGVGKNKIVDRLCQLLGRSREYVQLHRDTTTNSLMFKTSLRNGQLSYEYSPLLRAITAGRVLIVDEADKAQEHVVAVFRSLAAQSELTLFDGRRVCSKPEREGDIAVHPAFRLVLLANRSGYPFLGNHFLQVLGDDFSTHSVTNPDQLSEQHLIRQLAPELAKELVTQLVHVFDDLRKGYDEGVLNYPYSLRELINIVRHLRTYPSDTFEDALRNIFDFDIPKPEIMDKINDIFRRHGLPVTRLGFDVIRGKVQKAVKEIQFQPTETTLAGPKEGQHDDKEHSGGNNFAGGTGGRDTAGVGGRGGYKRLFKGGDIKQISDELKNQVPDHIKEQAKEMALQELQCRMQELDMTASEAQGYGALVKETSAHVQSLYNLLEHLAAKEDERVWVKRQTDGELDESRLTEGLAGESTVYKRRGMEKPEIGRPQLKPKRIRFLFDVSASMYRFQYDGRLQRSLETATMLMESFQRLSRKDKYVWDIYGHSGDGVDIPLVVADHPPTETLERWKVIEKMTMIPQYSFAGDYTVEAIEKGVKEVGSFDADDWFVIAITDANFGRYNITPEELSRAMKRDPKVHTAMICIGEGADTSWITKRFPGQAFRVASTSDIPAVFRSILSTMVDR